MARFATFIGFALLLVGCGRSELSSPAELADQSLRKGDYQAAIDTANEMLRANPRDAEAFVIRGRAHHYRNDKGDLDLAIADFTSAIGVAPDNFEAYYGRAIAYRESGDIEEAAFDQAKGRQLDPRIDNTYARMPDLTSPLPGSDASDLPDTETSATKSAAKGEPPMDSNTLPRFKARSATGPGLSNKKGEQASGNAQDKYRTLLSKPNYKSAAKKNTTKKKTLATQTEDDLTADNSESEQRPAAAEPLAPRDGSPARTARPRTPPRFRGDSPAMIRNPFAPPGDSALGAQLPQSAGGGRLMNTPGYQPPLQSPFPQRAPRPTGYVEEAPMFPTGQQVPARPQARPLYTPPAPAPIVDRDDQAP